MTDEPTAAERALYLAAIRRGGHLRPEDLAPADRPTLAVLVARGLLAPTATGYTAVNPRSVGDGVGTELRTRATRLLVHAERIPTTLAPLSHAYDAVPRPTSPTGDAIHIDGTADIRQRIAELMSDCREEFLAAQPGLRPLEGLRMALPQDLALLDRGCAMRIVYQPVAVSDREVLRQILLRTGRGAQVKVLAEAYQRVLIFDRSVAVIPASDDVTRAAVLTDPAVVAFLVAHFERDWARATPTDHHVNSPHPTTTRIGRLLARGLTQRAVATRLGLSERTVAAHISRLRDRHGAQTLFHLGWQMRGEDDA
ncbi:winged helix-turn-helix transcriptional regulator [Streptomyces kaniharaensis]|uniref:Winged helix-turn-helix transcriptional regulator n=1 Tax=Streptomyces kaniharaensis TaxID=212423 RepID=A0A6N7KP08_9ACTN|nr:LuxR C-terminal-related transcriptional regulator [Streptomyces kaniharaensis]MQS13270.1 winged helix-turn-helix transcriptional regulator [Streptomyces kaniharaensis]